MRAGFLVILLACVLVCARNAAAQAMGQTVVLTQQTMQSVGDNRQSTQIIHPAPKQTTDQQGQTPGSEFSDVFAAKHDFPDCGCAKSPFFRVPSGFVVTGTLITIASPSPEAVIYYTTDGWTPTEASPRYTAPITINNDTRLQAFAEESGKLPSPMVEVTFSIRGPQPPKPKVVKADDGILHNGTPLRLITSGDFTSDSAESGDPIPMLLDESVMVGDTVVLRKGTKVNATITSADRAGIAGKPGSLTIQVNSLDAHGIRVPLSASRTMAAPSLAVPQKIADPSHVQISGPISHGRDAEIGPGTPVIAIVSADTPLQPEAATK
jgi:hypothetical protein